MEETPCADCKACVHCDSIASQPENTYAGMQLDENGLPVAQGLYNPEHEKDACGVGFVVNITGNATRKVSVWYRRYIRPGATQTNPF